MTKMMPRGLLVWFALSAAILVLFAGVLELATRSVDCSVARGDADCDREAAAVIAGNINGAIFDRINVLAGHVPLVDQGMEFAARYSLFAIAGLAGLSWFIRTGSDRERRLGVYTALASAAGGLAVAVTIQHIYVHQRPFVLRSDVVLLIPHGADPSFPSEHTTAAFALATAIALYRPRLGVVLLLLACITAFSRIYVGLHYPADIAVGALLGMSAAIALWVGQRAFVWIDENIILRVLPRQLM